MVNFKDIETLKRTPDNTILVFLKTNPDFVDLKNEENGKYKCVYQINGYTIFVFNELGGRICTYLGFDFPDNDINSLYIAAEFARRVEIILNKKYKN